MPHLGAENEKIDQRKRKFTFPLKFRKSDSTGVYETELRKYEKLNILFLALTLFGRKDKSYCKINYFQKYILV